MFNFKKIAVNVLSYQKKKKWLYGILKFQAVKKNESTTEHFYGFKKKCTYVFHLFTS